MELLSSTELDAFRELQDPLADHVISKYFPADKNLLQSHLSALVTNSDSLPSDATEELKVLYAAMKETASSFDVDDLAAGQSFFSEHASDIMLLLGFLSLPYCYTAAYGAEVLVKSKRILEDPATRLMDTATFVFDVTSKGAFKPEGKALVVRGLRKLGKLLEPEKAFNYINYWNKIGLLLGLKPELLPESNKEAFHLEKQIRGRHFRSSDAGLKLTKSLYKYYEKAVADTPLDGLTKSFMIYLLGDKVASQLGLEIGNYDRIVFKPYQLFFNFKNIFFDSQDSYAKAFGRFKTSQAIK